jgi:hypothetical protein
MKDENHVVARRALFPTTLAPYASAVSNLLVFGGLLRRRARLGMTLVVSLKSKST